MKKLKRIYKLAIPVALLAGVYACGGGGGSNGIGLDNDVVDGDLVEGAEQTVVFTAENNEEQSIAPVEEIPLDPEQAVLLEESGFEAMGSESDTTIAPDLGDLLPVVFPTTTTVDLAYAQSGAALIERLNESLALPADITVNFVDCGTANAFFASAEANPELEFASAGGAIFMCHELTELFAAFYGDMDQAFAASIFVIMHELGHALVEQLDLPVLGIEESYVDGLAAVLVGESGMAQASVLAGWFFGSQGDTPFFDTHRANAQRLGDLACWGVGADASLLEDPIVNSIASQLTDIGGRNCVAEYQQQVNGLESVLGPNIRGGLGGILSAN